MNEQAVNNTVVDLGEKLIKSDDGVSVSEYRVKNLRSFNDKELDRLGKLNEESITRVQCVMESQERVAWVSAEFGETAGVSAVGHAVHRPTPVNLVVDVRVDEGSVDVTLVGSQVKRTLDAEFAVGEASGSVVGGVQTAKLT